MYYQFAPITDPVAGMLWQRALCEKLGLRGRILRKNRDYRPRYGTSTAATAHTMYSESVK